jgi:methionine-gamma-lyase
VAHRSIHAGSDPDRLYGAVSVPIYQSSTFAFESAVQGPRRFSGERG